MKLPTWQSSGTARRHWVKRSTLIQEVVVRLNNGDLFPSVSGPTVGGGSLTIPEDLKQEWNVVLFYRGHW